MIQITRIKALCCGAKSPAVMQSFTLQVTPHIGFYNLFFPTAIISAVIQNAQFYQTNLSMVSAGSDLTVSTCDLMILSAIDKQVRAWYLKREKGRASDKCWVN
jgi:hypothetical protein